MAHVIISNLGSVTPESHNSHGQRSTREPSPDTLQLPLLLHLPLDALAIKTLLSLNDNEILILLGRRLPHQPPATGILSNVLNPCLKAASPIEPVIDTVRSHGGRHAHPDQIGVLAVSGRDEIREKETAIGNVGEVQAVLTGQAFGFVEGADCVYGCWEKLQRGNGDV